MILEGSTNTTAFEVYVEQVLVLTLRAGQIVIMDNLQRSTSTRGQGQALSLRILVISTTN
jgi:hypothetical protein